MIPFDYDEMELKLTQQDKRYQQLHTAWFAAADDYERVLKQLSPEDRHAVEEYVGARVDVESRTAQLLATHYAINGTKELKAEEL